jgi:hypothetical protein
MAGLIRRVCGWIVLQASGCARGFRRRPLIKGPQRDWPRVDALVDWIIEKNKSGYKMVNSVKRLHDMKEFMRGKVSRGTAGRDRIGSLSG